VARPAAPVVAHEMDTVDAEPVGPTAQRMAISQIREG
jgi:hypothetical protein